MNSLLTANLIEKLGWTLFHSIWQFAGVAIVLWLVLRAVRNRSPDSRYLMQCCGLLSMVLLACVTFYSSESLSPGAARVWNSTENELESPQPTPAVADVVELTVSPSQDETESIVAETPADQVASPSVDERWSATTIVSTQKSLPERLSGWREEVLTMVAPWLTTMMSIWLLGVVLLSVRPLIGWRSVHRLRRVGIGDAPQSAVEAVTDVARKMGISRVIAIVESAVVEVPTVIGWMRPLILLPASAVTGLSREQLEAVIAHELAHIRRHDYLVNAIQVLLETIFFYHPAVWWVSRSMRIERESCCDEIAVGLTGKRTEYVKLLLRLEETRGTTVVVHPALSATGGTLMERIKSLTAPRSGRNSSSGFLLTMLMLSFFASCGLWLIASGSEPAEQTTADVLAKDANVVPNRYSFPDAPPNSENWKAKRLFSGARDIMEQATSDSTTLKPQDAEQVRESLQQLTVQFAGDPLALYAARRLVILNWQTGKISSAEASDRLKQLADTNGEQQRNFTLAMALTIDARTYNLESFQDSFASLRPAQTPQFGWFAFEWVKRFVKEYPHQDVTEAERMRGKPIAEEHRRSVAVADWLETQLLGAIDASLQHTEQEYANHNLDWKPDPTTDGLEAAQMAHSVEQIANATHQILARRLYPDVSKRAIDTLLPRTLRLWERAVVILETSRSTLASPDKHREKIQLFRERLLPQAVQIQRQAGQPLSHVPQSFRDALAGDTTFGSDSAKHVSQQQSIANWQTALEQSELSRQQQVFAWWRIGSLAAYNFDVNRGETQDYDLAAQAFEQVHAIGGDLVSRETLNAATVYSSLGNDAKQRAARRETAARWLNTRTDAMIANSVRLINHNGYCIDDDLMPGGMRLDTAAKKHAFLEKELAGCRANLASQEPASDSPWPVLRDGGDPGTPPTSFSNNPVTENSTAAPQVYRREESVAALQDLKDKIKNEPQRLHGMALYERNAMGWKWKVYLPPGKPWQIKGKVGRVPRGVSKLPEYNNQMKAIDIAPSATGRILDLEGHISSDGHGGEWLITVEADSNVFQSVDFAMWGLRRSGSASAEEKEAAEYVLGIRDTGAVSRLDGSDLARGRVTSKINDELKLVRWVYEPPGEPDNREGPGFMLWIATKESAGKQSASTSASPVKAAAQQLAQAAGPQTWKLESVDDQPTINIDGLHGYQMVLRRTWKEYTHPTQQVAQPGDDLGPFILKHEDWQFVLIPTVPQPAPADLKSKIPWRKSVSPYHTRDVCMGQGLGFVWFTRGTLYGQESVRDKLKLQGGDDRMALLIAGMQTEDMNAMTANSCQYAIARFGDAAIPAIENAIARSNDSSATLRLIGCLRLLQTDKATELMIRLYGSDDERLRSYAAYALIHQPFRERAKDAYLDMLRRHLRVYEACQACVQFQWQETIPILNDLIARPASLQELSFTIPARRQLTGDPIPQQLLDAKQQIISAGYNAAQDIDQPRKLLLESDDTEASLLIAIELATFTSKGSSRRPNDVGIELLKSRPRQATVDYVKSLIDAMPQENRQQAEKLLQSITISAETDNE